METQPLFREVHGQNLVQRIASASYIEEIMDYLPDGYSTQSLELTWEAIKLNPNNGWVWSARRHILEKGHYSNLYKEYDCIATLTMASEVNDKQIWLHRLWIAQKLGVDSMRQEFKFTMDTLVKNPLNGSAWFNVEQLSEKFGNEFLRDELLLTTNILSVDQENRYAWNHRCLLIGKLEASAARLEVEFAKDSLCRNAENAYAWSYMMDLIRMLKDDILIEALKFVDTILVADGGNTLAWNYRRDFAWIGILTGTAFLSDELEFTEVVLSKDANNKHAWSYRRWVLQKIGTHASSNELSFAKMILSENSKNEYAWYHRRWICEKFGGLEDELAYCDESLEGDIYNEAAWIQRSFVMRTEQFGPLELMRVHEVRYAEKAINKDPENGCAWMYLRRFYMKLDFYDQLLETLILKFVKKLPDVGDDIRHTRIYLNILETLWDVMKRGYKPSHEMAFALSNLCSAEKFGSSSVKAISKLSTKIYSALQDPRGLNVYHSLPRSCRDTFLEVSAR